MNAIRLLVAAAAVGCAAFALSQDSPPSSARKPKADPRRVEVVFADGSTVKMTLMQDDIEITSRYGKFKVPVEDIVRIEFGFRYPEGYEARVKAAIAGLGDPTFRQREIASAELLDLAEYAYPALQTAARSSDSEVAKRAEDLIKKIEETVDAEKLSIPKQDVIVTREFSFPGKIDTSHFKARTSYFGEIQVALSEIRGLRSIGVTTQVAFALDAAKYAGQDQSAWRDTGIEVTKDTVIEAEASGTIQIYQGNGYATQPDGYMSYQPPMGQPRAGALIARVGPKGTVFTLGAKFRGKAPESGRLYVRIQQSPWNNESTGSFEVKIRTSFVGAASEAAPPRPQARPERVVDAPKIEYKDKK
jgi:hypothetical protein